ncbi:MAG: hypothetical protein ACJA1A_000604 [Saprospiraceae bacterium]|jgi:hypothetical protein
MSSQSGLLLNGCNDILFPVNDYVDQDEDSNTCEAFITLKITAAYSSAIVCDNPVLDWVINLDTDMDGTIDIEYRSDLPETDTELDDTNNNGIPDLFIGSTLSGESQQLEVGNLEGPSSEHSIMWHVTDDCGVFTECNQVFHIEDLKGPIPYCSGTGSVLFDGDVFDVEIHAEDFNVGSYDNCTPSDELRFSFSGDSIVPSRKITCDDVINSPISINVYFWDNANSTDYCTTSLIVIPGPTVDCFPYQEVNGYVKTEDDMPIQNAEVILHCSHPEFPRSEFSDVNGYYSFDVVTVDLLGCYVTVGKDDDYITNVSTLDLVKVMRHILGLQPFTTPYQRIASDVTGDDKVSAADLVMLRRLILGSITEFSANSPWVFLDESYEFNDPFYPWAELEDMNASPHRINLSPNSEVPYSFVGIKLGNIVH